MRTPTAGNRKNKNKKKKNKKKNKNKNKWKKWKVEQEEDVSLIFSERQQLPPERVQALLVVSNVVSKDLGLFDAAVKHVEDTIGGLKLKSVNLRKRAVRDRVR